MGNSTYPEKLSKEYLLAEAGWWREKGFILLTLHL